VHSNTSAGRNKGEIFPGANSALALLIFIKLFNYIDRQALSAIVGPIKHTFFGANGGSLADNDSLAGLIRTPSYMLCTFSMAATTFAIGGIAFWMPYYLESRPNASSNSTVIFGAITAIASLIATLLGGTQTVSWIL
jgi:hypothetical protein